jgi:hypothetical protein
MKAHARLIRSLSRSHEPAIRWRTRVKVLGEARSSPGVRELERAIVRSPFAAQLLSHQFAAFREGTNRSVYHYWQGVHWALVSLVDMGYPAGEPAIQPLIDRALRVWLHPRYWRSCPLDAAQSHDYVDGVPVIEGRARRCASQQGNALLYASALGPLDQRTWDLAKLLEGWQWPDGGWNCDRRARADTSSFMETLSPMRGLISFARRTRDSVSRRAARRAAGIFLERRMFRRRQNGSVIRPDFQRLHYPSYWYYDILAGLKGMAEVGRIRDRRCSEALDWLESRELPNGGWPVDARHFRVSKKFETRGEYVNWGSPHRAKMNEWVTTDALYVLGAAGRLNQ